MLVLTRKEQDSVLIGNEIVVTVSQISGGRVKLAIQAPRHIRIDRLEVSDRATCRPAVRSPMNLSDSHEFAITAG
jgi:carbon storage regulator